jgi:Ca2+:H+ antiporter
VLPAAPTLADKLILLADAYAVATLFFVRYTLKGYLGTPTPPQQLAKGRAIDLSIQFMLFWLPFLVLLGWWTEKPLHMLFGRSSLPLSVRGAPKM